MEVREEHQDNTRGTRDVLTSQTVTDINDAIDSILNPSTPGSLTADKDEFMR
jgi:hypothetical protein